MRIPLSSASGHLNFSVCASREGSTIMLALIHTLCPAGIGRSLHGMELLTIHIHEELNLDEPMMLSSKSIEQWAVSHVQHRAGIGQTSVIRSSPDCHIRLRLQSTLAMRCSSASLPIRNDGIDRQWLAYDISNVRYIWDLTGFQQHQDLIGPDGDEEQYCSNERGEDHEVTVFNRGAD